MIYVDVDGEPQGPFSADELSALWQAGEIVSGARYWYRGMVGWMPIERFAAPPAQPQTAAPAIELTTAPTFALRAIERELGVVSGEGFLNLSPPDLLSLLTGEKRGQTFEGAVRHARHAALAGLQRDAHALGADGVLALRVSYPTAGGAMFVAASGTAVRLGPPPVQ